MFSTFGMCRSLPALLDLASMRDAVCQFDKDPDVVNFSCPVNLVVDHLPSVHFSQTYVYICFSNCFDCCSDLSLIKFDLIFCDFSFHLRKDWLHFSYEIVSVSRRPS